MKHLGPNLGFAIIVLGVFLLGAWFIRSGVMADPAAHLELFRWMAWIGLPLGLGLSVVAARIALTHVPGQNDGAFQLSMGLAFIGNLPACLGYIGVVVLLLHGRWRDWLAPLAPAKGKAQARDGEHGQHDVEQGQQHGGGESRARRRPARGCEWQRGVR